MNISVCTLAHGRAGHLVNLVRGLAQSAWRPAELVVTVLQDEMYDLPETDFPIRQLHRPGEGLSLAAARNASARAASGDLLVFLDVDCVPHPALLGDYAWVAGQETGIFMGEVAYLPKDAPVDALDFKALDAIGVTHSERSGPPDEALGRCRDYRCFWSLNFAMSAADFAQSGGFDEGYVGYGGEDTDFGRVCAEGGLPLWWVKGAKAYHQYHPHHMPPVHHIDSVIANAEYFADKWGEPTMPHWLHAFRLMGLAAPVDGRWQRLREVTDADLALTRQQEDQPFASTRIVLDELERRASLDREMVLTAPG